jgi:uncharacterized membrane protein
MSKSPISKDPAARLAERQNWITPRAEIAVQDAVRESLNKLGGETLRSALHGSWLHEPLHAVMTDVPVGSWTAAVVFDAIGAMSDSQSMDTAADACVGLGLIGAVGAAITGMNDWAEVKVAAPRRIGAVHALLNIAATGFFVGSLVARRKRGSRSTGRALGALGYVIASASAHLGGNLVYEHGIGVEAKE